MELLQSEGRAQTLRLLAMAQPSGLSLGKLQTVRFKDPFLETWMGGTDWTVCCLNSLDEACRCPQEGLWTNWNQGPVDQLESSHWWRLAVSNAEGYQCRAGLWLLSKVDPFVSQWERPHHEGHYPLPLLADCPHQTFEALSGPRRCLTTVGTLSGYWLAVPGHPTVALETNLCTQQWTDRPPLSPSFPPSPYISVRQFDQWIQVFQERAHSFFIISWVGIRTKGEGLQSITQMYFENWGFSLDQCWAWCVFLSLRAPPRPAWMIHPPGVSTVER